MRLVTLDEAPRPDGQPLFVDFVNTLHWYEGAPVELIGTDADFAAWLVEHRLPADDMPGCLPEIHRLREHIRGLTKALASGTPLPEADVAELQAALSAPVGSLTLAAGDSAAPHLSFATTAGDVTLFAFRIGLSVVGFQRSAQRRRLKLCANPGCGFAFVDTSINATRRWCFMRYCGNRLKVRAFRRRQAPGPHPSEGGR
jgi:predicted RNA-binding Zn ribbon-like protein